MPTDHEQDRPSARPSFEDENYNVGTDHDLSAHEVLAGALKESKRASNEVKASTVSTFFRTPSQTTVWRRGWKVPLGIVGFYLLALLIAVAHHAVFTYLNGRIVNLDHENLPFSSTNIPQAYATTFSLALVTAFRAAMIASIGLCYTQCLWRKLREELLQIGLIEELFQIRNNALRLLKPTVIRHAPLLLSVAVLSWLLPVAMIYPPGALVVGVDYRNVAGQFNVSVIPSGTAFDPFAMSKRNASPNTGFAELSTVYADNEYGATFFYDEPQPDLLFAAKTVLASSRIIELGRPSGANISYKLQFQGPTLQCQDGINTNTTLLEPEDLTPWLPNTIEKREVTRVEIHYPTYQVFRRDQGLYLVDSSNIPNHLSISPCPHARNESYEDERTSQTSFARFQYANGSTLLSSYAFKVCTAAVAKYSVEISFTNGVQKVSYSTSEARSLLVSSRHLEYFDYRPMNSIQEYVNLLALMDSLTVNFDLEGQLLGDIWFDLSALEHPKWINTTRDGVRFKSYLSCTPEVRYEYPMFGSTILALSAFNKIRFNNSDLAQLKPENFTVTEDLLNKALANITISSLALNKHFEMVNGTSTRVFNVYHFENRLSFYLPYGLCLLFTLPVLVFGLLALHHNGVTAIDGGFVQLLMTTTGQTKIEGAVGAGCLGGEENIPNEMKRMRVRFGEMVESERLLPTAKPADTPREVNVSSAESMAGTRDVDTSDDVERADTRVDSVEHCPGTGRRGLVRRAGFGLLEETIALEKGVSYGRSED